MPDQINSCFEFTAGILLLFNVVKIYKDKQARGISLIPLTFMVVWGFWNCYFYPAVGARWSFWAGLLVAIVNTVWFCQIIYYHTRRGNPNV